MRISEQWLREWLQTRLKLEDIAERLTQAGIEVAGIFPAGPVLDKVVVGEIETVDPHPQADRLKLCRVRVGKNTVRQIVCGAPNAAAGLRVPTALPGARLPGDKLIAESDVRGVRSEGMLCSAAELGLAETADGLLVLPPDSRVGESLRKLYELDDRILEIELTPNRGDCLSVLGLARELAAVAPAKLATFKLKAVAAKARTQVKVRLAAKNACPHYVGLVIEGLDPRVRTPLWLQERLRRAGVRSLHPVVDVSNYVMLELGQPLHAFDLAKLNGPIDVRYANEGEPLRLLDGRDVALDGSMLVIADRQGPLAVAGVMGGEASAVSAATTDIFIESAYFAPAQIGPTARRLGLHSESSHRFERGVDFALQQAAIARARELILGIAGGKSGPIIKVTARAQLPKRPPILLRKARLQKLLGSPVPDRRVIEILRALGLRTKVVAGGWQAIAPTFRFDLQREVDLIEEVARVEGYANWPSRLPRAAVAVTAPSRDRLDPHRLREVLVDREYHEILTYSFVDPAVMAQLEPRGETMALKNPLASNMAVMRRGLWPGLLQALQYNRHRQQTRVRLFELGRCFLLAGRDVEQPYRLAGLIAGERWPRQWAAPAVGVDFFDLKGDVEAVLALSGQRAGFAPGNHPALQPGQSAVIEIDGRPVGVLGRLHPRVAKTLDIDTPVYAFELDLAPISQVAGDKYREVARFPSIRRDLAMLVDRDVPAAKILAKAQEAAGNLLVEADVFDDFRGEGIDSGRKSLGLTLTLQDFSRTLNDEVVDATIAEVVMALEKEFGAKLRT